MAVTIGHMLRGDEKPTSLGLMHGILNFLVHTAPNTAPVGTSGKGGCAYFLGLTSYLSILKTKFMFLPLLWCLASLNRTTCMGEIAAVALSRRSTGHISTTRPRSESLPS